ncbi:dynein regulatory complex subunit 4-like isoform X2 [Siniperca chuatsi]|nr:dynein regulatory complex subunit 4-like isoform X2 [Siniperca chuatsi]
MPLAQPTKTEGETKETVEEKSPAVLDRPPTAEKTMDEQWKECVSLQEELETDWKQKKHFKIQRDKTHRSFDNSKRNLEENKARIRENLRLKQKDEQCCQTEIEEHKQKLKQLETAHHSEICELKVAAIARTSKTQKEHVESEVKLQKKMCNLRVDQGERESCIKIYTGKLKQKQQDELRELNESYEKQVREMEAKYMNKINIMAEENHQSTQIEVNEIDKRVKKHTLRVVAEHDKVWEDFNEFNKKKHNVCLEKEKLVRQVVKKKDKQVDGTMAAAVQENKCLTETLQEMEPKLCESRQQLAAQRKAMAESLKKGSKMNAQIFEERCDLYLKHQQLEMKHRESQLEFDELQKRQSQVALGMQQKSGLKALFLERKIKAVTEIQEKEQLKLWVVLAFGQGVQTAAKNIKELFVSKDATINDLMDDLSRDLKEYDNLVKKETTLDISVGKWLPRGDIKKCIRNALEDKVPLYQKNFEGLMQELTALCISEDNSVLKDALGLNPAGTASR